MFLIIAFNLCDWTFQESGEEEDEEEDEAASTSDGESSESSDEGKSTLMSMTIVIWYCV